MAVARAAMRVVIKPMGKRAPYRVIKGRSEPDPPKGVAGRHEVEVEYLDGVRCVWLDRHQAAGHGVLAHLHGGAYIMGPERNQWGWMSEMARQTGAAVLMVDYSPTPEAAYPTALEEVLRAIGTLDHPWVLGGDSAGGALALATAFRLRDGGRPLPGGLVLTSPWLDLTMSNPDARANHRIDAMLSLRGLSRGAVPYAGPANPCDPHLSPLFGDPAGLPPMQIEVGTRELFLWDVREWGRRCREAGADCDVVETEGGFHDFPMAVGLVPEAADAVARQVRFVRERLAA